MAVAKVKLILMTPEKDFKGDYSLKIQNKTSTSQ